MIRLFVGCPAANEDLEQQAVLEYTLRKYASEPVEITWMMLRKGDGWNTASFTTPFTPLRWSVPERCNYEGRAIYCDADVIFRADIAELWHQEIPGVLLLKSAEGKLRTCVMLMDCAKMEAHIPKNLKSLPDAHATVRGQLSEHRELLSAFSGAWNCVDLKRPSDMTDPEIKLIHYSRISTQPSMPHALARLKAEGGRHWYDGELDEHPRPDLVALFDAELVAAQAAGYTLDRYAVEPFGDYRKKSLKSYGAKRRAA